MSKTTSPDQANMSRRRFLQCAGLGAVGVAAFLTDACLIEPNHIEVEQLEIPLARLGKAWDGLRIVQLSDFHYVRPRDGELIRKAVRLANGLNPDVVVLTGDYVTSDSRPRRTPPPQATPCAEILSELRATLGVFAVLGNHDGCNPQSIARTLDSRGIAVLRNTAIYIERNGDRL